MGGNGGLCEAAFKREAAGVKLREREQKEKWAMEERESKRRSREGVRWIIRERIMEELQERHHMDDGELLEMIDRSIGCLLYTSCGCGCRRCSKDDHGRSGP